VSIELAQKYGKQAIALLNEHSDQMTPAERAAILASVGQIEATLTLADHVISTLPSTTANLMDVAGVFSSMLPQFERVVNNLANTLDR